MSRESHKGYELWVRSKGPLQARISSQRIHESERESDKQWCVRQTCGATARSLDNRG